MKYLIKTKAQMIPSSHKIIAAVASTMMLSCGAPSIISTPIENIDTLPLKTSDLTQDQLKNWGELDLISDTIPGMSINKAYTELIKNKKGKTVIVGVIDSGIDIEHEDLDGVIWTNTKEIKGNGKDDDNNGYIDDIHGWNYLGDTVDENLEFVRIVKQFKPKFDGKTLASVAEADKDEYQSYIEAKAEYDEKYQKSISEKTRYEQIYRQSEASHKAVAAVLGKEDYTKEELLKTEAKTTDMQQHIAFLSQMFGFMDPEDTVPDFIKTMKGGLDYYADQLNYNLNIEFDPRAIVGDDVDNFSDNQYGNNNVMGPADRREDLKHGTHVAGTIGAERNNNQGMNGVANNVKIMALRAVPNGDEYDKDIALAIRYAVDNGAKIINTSFGKYYSTHPEWVRDAIKYAASKDVLIVNAAGNSKNDLDQKIIFPNDQIKTNAEIADNFITIGALNYKYGSDLIATFSNYGKTNVDVFAPGVKIWSTTPNNSYAFLQGTSMASPAVAGIAAMIRSYYPKLKASQVKQILMDSGVPTKTAVVVGGDPSNVKSFSEISKSGKMVNLYNALIMADKLSK